MHHAKKIFFALIFCGFIISRAGAVPMDWDSVLASAKKYNQSLIKAELAIKQAELNFSKAKTNFYPQLSAQSGYSESGVLSDGEDQTSSGNYSIGLSGSLSIFSGYSDVTELKIQRLNIASEKEKFSRVMSDVIYNLKASYINLLAAQEMVSLWQDINKQRTANYNLVQLKYQAGREDKGSLLRMEADKIQADYELANALQDVKSADLELMKNIGTMELGPITATGGLEPNTAFAIDPNDTALAGIPEFKLQQYEMDKAELTIKQSKSSFYPSISLSSGISMNVSQPSADNASWNLGLQVSYPLTTNYKQRFEVQRAKNSLLISQKSFEAEVLAIRAAWLSAGNDLSRAAENVAIQEKYLEASSEQSKITSVRYLNGLVAYSEWYTVENDYINAKKSLLSAKKTAILARAKLNNILGKGE